MSSEFWTDRSSLFTLADTDILLAIDATDNTSKQFLASVLKTFVQATWETDVNANNHNLSNLDVLTFANDTGSITGTDYGIVRTSGDNLQINVGNALDDIELTFNSGLAHLFTSTFYNAPTILADKIELINPSGANPVLTSNSANQDLELTGNFGIGITEPAEPLDVLGNIRFTNFRTRTLQRTIPANVGGIVDVGSFTFTQGAGSLIVTITVNTSSFSVAKEYLIPV